MGFNCGIVGLPNVGKSTLFNALTQTAAAEAANYPFCTIEPNVGRVAVPDDRLLKLAQLAGSKEIIPTQLEFVDIAGLVKGASKGEGLGNQFLGHIREVDAICHLLRCFEDGDITHTLETIDPLRDKEVIDTELVLADMESLAKQVKNLEKKAKGQDKQAKALFDLGSRVLSHLESGYPVRTFNLTDDEKVQMKSFGLLTGKPVLYICNVDEASAVNGNALSDKVKEVAEAEGNQVVVISAEIEKEIALLENMDERKEFLESLGLEDTGLARVIQAGYRLLNLITYFTIGPKEAHAWTIVNGTKGPKAAGVIHSDFEKGFIRAETIGYQDYIDCGTEQEAKAKGKMRTEGKEYVVQDGDILHFLFN